MSIFTSGCECCTALCKDGDARNACTRPTAHDQLSHPGETPETPSTVQLIALGAAACTCRCIYLTRGKHVPALPLPAATRARKRTTYANQDMHQSHLERKISADRIPGAANQAS